MNVWSPSASDGLIVHTASGREVIVSHPGIDTPLHMAWRDAELRWEDTIPSGSLVSWGLAWRPAVRTVTAARHFRATPTANGSLVHNGQDGAMLYYRSQDGDTRRHRLQLR